MTGQPLRCLHRGLDDCPGCSVCLALEQLQGAVEEPVDLELALEAALRLTFRRAS